MNMNIGMSSSPKTCSKKSQQTTSIAPKVRWNCSGSKNGAHLVLLRYVLIPMGKIYVLNLLLPLIWKKDCLTIIIVRVWDGSTTRCMSQSHTFSCLSKNSRIHKFKLSLPRLTDIYLQTPSQLPTASFAVTIWNSRMMISIWPMFPFPLKRAIFEKIYKPHVL